MLGVKMRFDDLKYFDMELYMNLKSLKEMSITEDHMIPLSLPGVLGNIAEEYFKDQLTEEAKFVTDTNKEDF
jgi:hypothetical protein